VCVNVNVTSLSRYSELNEKTYRRHFQQVADVESAIDWLLDRLVDVR